ncbi:hypothetical protein RclHR1_05530015 [Rhizophagus clarus]|nr:hypothetical protein RclHR1_05530015 [Rhizophagus clarus]
MSDKATIEDVSNETDEQNLRSPQKNNETKASGNDIFDTSNPALRNRQRQPTTSVQSTNNGRNNINRISFRRYKCFPIFLIIIILFIFYFSKHTIKERIIKEEIKDDTDSILENMARMADSTSKELSELEIPGTSAVNKYRAVFLNLGAILNNSDVIIQNGAQIARDLFKLSDDFGVAGQELSKFVDQAEDFIYSLSSELNAIYDRLNQRESFLINYFRYETNSEYIHDRLKVLENNVPGFQEQLKRVIDALQLIKQRSIHTQNYLITGEKEAQKVLMDHWVGNIANYEERKRAEEERQQVIHVLQLLKDMLPNLLDFESFLNRYREQLQDVKSKIKINRAKIEPSKDTLKYLLRAAEKLEINHKNFARKENQLGQKPKNTLYLEDEMNAMHRDCTEFDIQFTKSNNVHLKKIRIWRSHFINALAFFYSDDSIEMFGTPGSSEPFDFEWHKDEKIKRFEFNFAAIVYGIKITTTRGRNTGWHGGNSGHNFYTEMEGRTYNGLFGSFSKYICSLEVSHGQSST